MFYKINFNAHQSYPLYSVLFIQKKSREESEGRSSGVEIIENCPYTDGPNGSGQYTYKIYHIGRHLPSWFRSIAPKTALEVHEESWNAYPYTKTKFSVPFVDKFSLEVETYFEPDGGSQVKYTTYVYMYVYSFCVGLALSSIRVCLFFYEREIRLIPIL